MIRVVISGKEIHFLYLEFFALEMVQGALGFFPLFRSQWELFSFILKHSSVQGILSSYKCGFERVNWDVSVPLLLF